MKKITAIVLLLVIVIASLGVFVACDKQGKLGADFTVPEGGYDGSAVTIKFYHTMGQSLRKVLDKHIAKFNEIYPNIKVDHSQVGGYDEVLNQINTELAGGSENAPYAHTFRSRPSSCVRAAPVRVYCPRRGFPNLSWQS